VLVALAGCGAGGSAAPAATGSAPGVEAVLLSPVATTPPATTPPATTPPAATPPALPSAPATVPAAPTAAPPRVVPTTRAPTSAPAGPAACAVPAGVTATQVLLVDGHGASATIRGCVRSGTRWVTELGPFAGHVGRSGVTTRKREGDGGTPAGIFPLRGGFGTAADPGLALGWSVVDGADVWVDDPASSLYNSRQRDPAVGRWSSAEHLAIPQYRYAQVIGYNEARTPGLGSAIFLHVDSGAGTAGCVALPTAALLAVLRWERPGAVITIIP
jgi:L,D-peptidoglycan transpeptidase YkuD (ErfK/YbiS/YcfS/YnhG family)